MIGAQSGPRPTRAIASGALILANAEMAGLANLGGASPIQMLENYSVSAYAFEQATRRRVPTAVTTPTAAR